MRDVDGRLTVTKADMHVLGVVFLAGSEGALLAGRTRPEHNQVDSAAARRLARDGLLTIDPGAVARLTDQGRKAVDGD